MNKLTKSWNAWDTPAFEETFKTELPGLGNKLPLQQGLSAGSYAVADPVQVMVISRSADDEFIRVKAALFYTSLTPGCACAGDPTVESEQNELVTVLISIDRKTAVTTVKAIDV